MRHKAKYTGKQPFDGKRGPAGATHREHQVRPWELTFPLWHSKGTLCALSRLSFWCSSYLHQLWDRFLNRSGPSTGTLSLEAGNVRSRQPHTLPCHLSSTL